MTSQAASITDNFGLMILGVQNATTLDDKQKAYIIELLQDQLEVELHTLMHLEMRNA